MSFPFACFLSAKSFVFFALVFFHARGADADLSCNFLQCGKGRCKVSNNSLFLGLLPAPSFSCECDPGWTRFSDDGNFDFLPCVIPNCTLDYSCTRWVPAPAPSVSQLPTDWFSFDLCSLKMCGEGTCIKTSVLSHRCDCKPGYSNLLNISIFPCFPSCVFSADCSNLGITFPDTPSLSPPPPPNASDDASVQSKDKLPLVLLSMLLIFLARV